MSWDYARALSPVPETWAAFALPARPEGSRGAAEVCGAPCAPGAMVAPERLGELARPHTVTTGLNRCPRLMGQCIPASP